MTFKEISAWIEVVAIVALYGFYLSQAPVFVAPQSTIVLYIGVAAVFIAVNIVLHIIAALLHRPEHTDERDRFIAAKASRNASYVLGLGVFTATMLLMAPAPLLATSIRYPQITLAIHLLVLTAAAGELTRFSSQIVYYRRGA